MKKNNKPPNNVSLSLKNSRPRLAWHERESPVYIQGKTTKKGIRISIKSKELTTDLQLVYPNSIWDLYKKDNKVKLLDNITYIFTSHLPLLLRGNVRLEYNTGYPHSFSWTNQCFMRFLPSYWYLYRGKRGTKIFSLLKTILNSRSYFAETKDVPPQFPETIDEHVILPFTFGKDSFLTYHFAKELGLSPTLVYFNEPTELFSRHHKLALIEKFSKTTKEKIYFMDNPLGSLRDYGEGWFGWELALTSWALLSLPFAYKKKAGYIVFSNEESTNSFFYDEDGFKVMPDYEQSGQATEELSILTQALSEGEVYTTTFLQGLSDMAIIGILKHRYFDKTFIYLMSCWAENENARNKRWCGNCSKCARLYIYLSALGVHPIKDAGFKDNMLKRNKMQFFNVFGTLATGTGWDSFGLNTEEQALAFYLSYLRGNREPLIQKFTKTQHFDYIKTHYALLIHKYFSLTKEHITPHQWKGQIDAVCRRTLSTIKKELLVLKKK